MAYKFNALTGQFDLVNTSSPSGGGDVNGPGSSVNGDIVIFSGTSGKSIADSGISINQIQPYVNIFSTGNWIDSGTGSYFMYVSASSHLKTNPIINIYEVNGSDYLEVTTGVRIDPSNNVTITINSIPDLRFSGKLIIS